MIRDLKLRPAPKSDAVTLRDEPAAAAARRSAHAKGDGITTDKPRMPSPADPDAGEALAPKGPTFKLGPTGAMVPTTNGALVIRTPPPPPEMQRAINEVRTQLDQIDRAMAGRDDTRVRQIRAVIAESSANLDACQSSGWTGGCGPVLALAQLQGALAAQMLRGSPLEREVLLREAVDVRQDLVDAFRGRRISFETYLAVDQVLDRADALALSGEARAARAVFEEARAGIANNSAPPTSGGSDPVTPPLTTQPPVAEPLPQWVQGLVEPRREEVKQLARSLELSVEAGTVDEATAAALRAQLDRASAALTRAEQAGREDNATAVRHELDFAAELLTAVSDRLGGDETRQVLAQTQGAVADLREAAMDALRAGTLSWPKFFELGNLLGEADAALARARSPGFTPEAVEQLVERAQQKLAEAAQLLR